MVPCNDSRWLKRTLDSLLNQTSQISSVIVVADGIDPPNSNNEKVTEYRTTGWGKARVVNHVVKRLIKTEQVLVIDADSFLVPDGLEKMQKLLTDGTELVMPRISPSRNVTWIEKGRERSYRRKEAGDIYLNLGCCFLTRTAWFATQPFPEDTMAEDQDFASELRQKSVRVRFCSNATCFTEEAPNWRSMIRQETRWTYGDLQIRSKRRRASGPIFVLRESLISLVWIFLAVTVKVHDRRYSLVSQAGALTAIGYYILSRKPTW